MKVFVTKYALGIGGKIIEADMEQVASDRVYGKINPRDMFPSGLTLGRDAFEDRHTAVMAAEKARDRKIASLEKKIAALKELKF